ncbi:MULTISPECIES: hypothetical protein [Brevibacillus]|nr:MULTISPECIES: hypothetical protein [Brevibacillus]MDH6349581.1 hypothetical protein [Brevibacillus sp. 1238]MDR4999037.1 hypothetical protein [Brevibacillus parabrevis]MED2254410.1 hypothetical protein [Brevibacillus parabrevis]WDV93606.1 hypothetical protein PSE45_18340 [Brevibacillus parabrevis]
MTMQAVVTSMITLEVTNPARVQVAAPLNQASGSAPSEWSPNRK